MTYDGLTIMQAPQFVEKTCAFVGAAVNVGQPNKGVEQTPDLMREAGIKDLVQSLNWKFVDAGNFGILDEAQFETGVKTDMNVKNCYECGVTLEDVYKGVQNAAKEKQFVMTVGGDHSVGAATLSAMKSVHDNLVSVYVASHADFNTPSTTPSGNYHGMINAHATGLFPEGLPGFEWMDKTPKLQPKDVGLIGLRQVDDAERLTLIKHNCAAHTMFEVEERGIAKTLKKVLKTIDPHSTRPIHLSFDIDVCDPSIAPGTGTLSRGGLSFREVKYICEALRRTGRLVSMDLVEINSLKDVPAVNLHDDDGLTGAKSETLRLGMRLMAATLGDNVVYR